VIPLRRSPNTGREHGARRRQGGAAGSNSTRTNRQVLRKAMPPPPGGGDYRQCACAFSPCYLCVTAALSATEALTSGRPSHRSPAAWADGAGRGRHQRACGPLPSRLRLAPQGHAVVLWFSRLSAVCPTPAGGEAYARTRCWGARAHVGQARNFVFV
jgi:hypothetical protein